MAIEATFITKEPFANANSQEVDVHIVVYFWHSCTYSTNIEFHPCTDMNEVNIRSFPVSHGRYGMIDFGPANASGEEGMDIHFI